MEKKKVVPVWLSVLLALLCIAGIAFNIYDLVRSVTQDSVGSVFYVVTDVLACLLYISALVYCFMGYQKKAAAFFRAFCIIALISEMTALYLTAGVLSQNTNNVVFISSLLTFGAWCIVAFVSDLGKKQSFVAAWVIVATTVISAFFNPNTYFLVKMLFQVVVCVIFLIMVYGKYQDKAARGTK